MSISGTDSPEAHCMEVALLNVYNILFRFVETDANIFF